MAGRSFGRKKNYGLTVTVSSKPWCFVWMPEKRNHPLSNKTGSLILNKTKTAISTKRIDFYHHKGLGCAFRFVFRFIPVLIFRNSGYSAEFPEFRGTHVGIKSFHGKINLHRNSGSAIPEGRTLDMVFCEHKKAGVNDGILLSAAAATTHRRKPLLLPPLLPLLEQRQLWRRWRDGMGWRHAVAAAVAAAVVAAAAAAAQSSSSLLL